MPLRSRRSFLGNISASEFVPLGLDRIYRIEKLDIRRFVFFRHVSCEFVDPVFGEMRMIHEKADI